MTARLFVFALLIPFTAGDGEKDGRRGNELYRQGQYEEAVHAYTAALAALDDSAEPWLRYALQNNLGAAFLKSGDAAAASEAFGRALLSAPHAADAARTHYNSGNAEFGQRRLEQSLENYRQSLLRDPDNEDAKFNYEFVKRQLQQQQQQNQQQSGQNDQDRNEQSQENQNDSGNEKEEQKKDQQQESDQQNSGNEESEQGDEGEEREGEEPQESQSRLSQEQAERILRALQNEEEQLLRQVQRPKSRPRRVEKDW
jgi:tetratricopeptide (TPR) repeat protein